MGTMKEEERVSQPIELWRDPRDNFLLCFDAAVKPGNNNWCKILYGEDDKTVRIEMDSPDDSLSSCGKFIRVSSFNRKDHKLVDYRRHIVVSMMGGTGYYKKQEVPE